LLSDQTYIAVTSLHDKDDYAHSFTVPPVTAVTSANRLAPEFAVVPLCPIIQIGLDAHIRGRSAAATHFSSSSSGTSLLVQPFQVVAWGLVIELEIEAGIPRRVPHFVQREWATLCEQLRHDGVLARVDGPGFEKLVVPALKQ
jgi:hypothetical protein